MYGYQGGKGGGWDGLGEQGGIGSVNEGYLPDLLKTHQVHTEP